MADNALGNLFTEMAESIRGGLGYIGKMKPITFPEKVDEIVALLEYYKNNSGGSSGEESDSPLKFTSGIFHPTADRTRMTIEHGLGCMPDFVMVYQAGIADYSTVEEFCEDFPILFTWGFKSSFNAGFLTGLNFPGWGFTQKQYGIDNVPEESQDSGFIYCPDESTFQVGMVSTSETGSVGLASGATYNWIAVTGMGSVTEPVVQELTITENGTYTAPAGVDGYNPVTVNVDPTKVTILREQQISGFESDADFGYSVTDPTPTYAIEEGKTYCVVWDGVEYETTAMSADSLISGSLFMGNGTSLGLPGNNEPFAIGYMNGAILYTAFTDDSESHTVGIYQKVTQEIKLQDKTITENGEYTADEGYDGLGKVLVQLASSGGAAGIERVTIVPEQTATPTLDSSYGAYKYEFTPSEKLNDNNVYAILFDGVWYICSKHSRAFTAGSLTGQKIGAFGNHVIMKKFYSYSITWKDNTAQDYPFLLLNQSWIMTASSASFTFRIDKLTITA